MKMITCTGCSRPILDRFLLNVSDEYWHSECVMCSECKVKLTEKCFSREGKLFCRNDFFKKFGTKCSGCMQGIQPTDFVRRAKSQVFHLKCFTCFICRKQLSTGEELYVTEDNRFICKEDFLNSRQSHARVSASPADELDDSSGLVSPPESESNVKFEEDDRDDDLLSTSSSLGLTTLSSTNSASAHLNHLHSSQHTIGHHPHGGLHSGHPPHPHPHAPHLHYGGPPPMMGLPSKSSPLSASSSLSDSGHAGPDSYGVNSPGASNGSMGGGSTPGGTTGGANGPASNNNSATGGGSSSSGGAGNDENTPGTKRRGPRTTIKAKQLETLKNAFNQTPKPTRHIREQLAAETGLNMRVIQVWFQNRRSKERRMKQVSSMGARRHFFRSPRRAMRPLRPGLGTHDELDDSNEMVPGPPGGFPFYSGPEGAGPDQNGGSGGPAYYDLHSPFFGPPGSGPGGPYPDHPPHPYEGGPGGPAGIVPEAPSIPGIESAGGWPMSQM